MLKRDHIPEVFLFTEGSATTHLSADGAKATLWRNSTGQGQGQSQPLPGAPGWPRQNTKNRKALLLHSQSLTAEPAYLPNPKHQTSVWKSAQLSQVNPSEAIGVLTCTGQSFLCTWTIKPF